MLCFAGDLDGDGRVDKDEFLIWHLYHLGYKPDVETYAMFYAADTDGDGDVSETTRSSTLSLSGGVLVSTDD